VKELVLLLNLKQSFEF